MSYFIHLSLLLVIVFSSHGNHQDLPLLGCQWKKNISCRNGKDVWQIHGKKEHPNWILSLSCTGEVSSSCSGCLKIEIPTTENDQSCRGCCETGNSCDCGGKCPKSCTMTMPATTQTLSVKYPGQCKIDLTDNVTVVPLKFFDEKKSWIKALQHCHNLSYSLVHFTNQTVQEEVKNLMQCQSELEHGVWVGLERSIFGTDLEWKWTSGSTAVNPGWIENFPADSLNNHCGKLIWHTTSETIKLVDANCHDELPFICQR